MRYPFFLLLFFVFLSAPALAQENKAEALKVPTPVFDDLKLTKSGRIDKVIDGLTLLLKDDTIVRLASLDIPDFNERHDAPYAEAALAYLQKSLPEGTEIKIYQTRVAKKGRVNRMNHQLGHILTKKDGLWINGALLNQGLARVYTAPNAPEINNQMLNIEQNARKVKLGMWEDKSPHLVLTPETADQAMGKLAIIEGAVEKTASVKNNIYLNFGKDWKIDFTIMITPALRKKLARRGVDLLNIAGQKIRVRGYLREYNGALIELEAPEHLEYPLLQGLNETPTLKTTP